LLKPLWQKAVSEMREGFWAERERKEARRQARYDAMSCRDAYKIPA